LSVMPILTDALDLDVMAATGAPFGDSDYIHDELHALCYRRLERIADRLPLASELAQALAGADRAQRIRFLGHPSAKIAIQHAFREVVGHTPTIVPFADCTRVLERMLCQLQLNYQSPRGRDCLLSGFDCVGPHAYHPYIWCDDNSDDPFRSVFRRVVHEHFEDAVASGNSATATALQRGIALLEEVVPRMTRSALSHVQIIALFPARKSWRKTGSCSQFSLSGAVFLQLDSLEDPWWVAEHLLHEALHQKLYDIRITHSLIARESLLESSSDDGATPTTAGTIAEPPWNRLDPTRFSQWPLSRVMAALHVYAHLAIFGDAADRKLADLERKFGIRGKGPKGLVSSRAAFQRAWFLLDSMRECFSHELGPAGELLGEWANQCLDLLGPEPSRPRVRLRSSLDRYQREARAAQAILNKLPADKQACSEEQAALVSDFTELLLDELGETSEIVRKVGEEDAAQQLEATGVDLSILQDSSSFMRTRSDVAAELIKALSFPTPDLIMVNDGNAALVAVEAAQRMIDASTDRLEPVLSRWQFRSATGATHSIVTQISEALDDKRAWLLSLTDILGGPYGTKDFCLFLYALVRMNRPTSIVELGSGFGASSFWMALASKQNGAGHVWSFDDNTNADLLPKLLNKERERLEHTLWEDLESTAPEELMTTISRRLGLTSFLTFVRERISFDDPTKLDIYPIDVPIDLLFSDFRHDASAILDILGCFLPKMSPASSIFIDSASTSLPSYLLLENIVTQLQRGVVPLLLQKHAAVDLQEYFRSRRVTLVHITKAEQSHQNSVAWLKLEPADVIPHPRTVMRGF
jgi:hypothetical protein